MPQIGQLPGPVAHDLRVHRAGPLRALRRRRRGRRLVADEALGFGDEPLAAARAAEEIRRGRHIRRGGARSPGPRSCRRPDRSPSPAAARLVAVMLVARVRGIGHGADVECAAATIKRTRLRGARSAGARGAVKNEVEPLAGRVVQAAYMVEFDRREPGVLQKPEKRLALIGADQRERASRVAQQVLPPRPVSRSGPSRCRAERRGSARCRGCWRRLSQRKAAPAPPPRRLAG